ncbi:MAG: hypothetical protein DSZ23_06440 [Thermodesulfatator sp.]|nr:MAG: hypothetical protein DSZ23_06440 [Thermodesulfatator sp.]
MAGSIGDVNATNPDEQGPYFLNIEVTGCKGDNTVISDSLGSTFLVQVFAHANCVKPDCTGDDCDLTETFTVSVEVPPCHSYDRVKVQLFNVNCEAKTPETGLVTLEDSRILEQKLEIRQIACCASILEQCLDSCGDNETCKQACQDDYEECMNETLTLSLSCHPETFNMKSHGNWITCHLAGGEENVSINDIDYSSVVLAVGTGTMAPDWYNQEGDALMLKFSRDQVGELINALEDNPSFPMTVQLTVTGDFYDGRHFEAFDTIDAINPGEDKKSNKGAAKGKGHKP